MNKRTLNLGPLDYLAIAVLVATPVFGLWVAMDAFRSGYGSENPLALMAWLSAIGSGVLIILVAALFVRLIIGGKKPSWFQEGSIRKI